MSDQRKAEIAGRQGLDAKALKEENLSFSDLLAELEIEEKRVQRIRREAQENKPDQTETLPDEPVELRESEPVASYIDRLKRAVLKRGGAVHIDAPEFVVDYRKTFSRVMQKLIREVTYGQPRERLMAQLADFDLLNRVKPIDREGARLLDAVFQARVRDSKDLLKKQITKALSKVPGRVKAAQRIETRKLDAGINLLLADAKRISKMSADDVDKEADLILRELSGEIDAPDGGEIDEGRERLLMRYELLHRFGNLREKTSGELAETLAWVESQMVQAVELQAQRIAARKAQLDAAKAAVVPGLAAAFGKFKTKGPKGRGSDAFACRQMAVRELFRHLVRYAKGTAKTEAERVLDDISLRCFVAAKNINADELRSYRELLGAVQRCYGVRGERRALGVLAEICKTDERLKEFSHSKNPTALSRQQLMQQIAFCEQADYEKNIGIDHAGVGWTRAGKFAAMNRALSAQDHAFIGWLREYYKNQRGWLDGLMRARTGLGLPESIYNYMPAAMKRQTGAPGDLHKAWRRVPAIFERRVRNSLDMDETVGVIDLFLNRSRENSIFKHNYDVANDLGGLFGMKDVRGVLDDAYGEATYTAVWNRVGVLMRGKEDRSGEHEAAANFMMKFGWVKMNFNLVSAIKQASSYPAVLIDLPVREVMAIAFTQLGTAEGRAKWVEVLRSDWAQARFEGGGSHIANALISMGNDANDYSKSRAFWMLFRKSGLLPNRFVDVLTVTSHVTLDYFVRRAQLVRAGYDEATADTLAMQRAWQDAESLQQSAMLPMMNSGEAGGDMLFKTVGMFQSQPRQLLARELADFLRAKASGRTEDWQQVGKDVFVFHVLIPTAWTALGMLAKGLLGEKPDEETLWTWIASLLLGPFSSLLIAGSVLESCVEHAIYAGRVAFGEKHVRRPFGGTLMPAQSWMQDAELLSMGAVNLASGLLSGDDKRFEQGRKQAVRVGLNNLPPARDAVKFYENWFTDKTD